MIQAIIASLKMDVTMMSYPFGKEADLPTVQKKIDEKLTPILKFLGDKKFLVGENETYMDFYFYEVCQFAVNVLQPELFTLFPTTKTYCENVANLPGLKEYLADPNRREVT